MCHVSYVTCVCVEFERVCLQQARLRTYLRCLVCLDDGGVLMDCPKGGPVAGDVLERAGGAGAGSGGGVG